MPYDVTVDADFTGAHLLHLAPGRCRTLGDPVITVSSVVDPGLLTR